MSRNMTPEEVKKLHSLYAAGKNMTEIAAELNRSYNGVWQRLRAGAPRGRAEDRPPQNVVAEWRRYLSLAPRDTTALLMGDPVPGRSALDRR